MKTIEARKIALAAVKAGMPKEELVSRFVGVAASLVAREYELATLGYVLTARKY